MNSSDRLAMRERLVAQAMALIERRGSMITMSDLAAETGMSRARLDELFPEGNDLFDAIVEQWYSHDIIVMEEVLASDLPIQRKFYEFFAKRFMRERQRHDEDPALFSLYVELGTAHFEQVRGYIDLADHYLTELIAQAQDEGYFAGLTIDRALSLINQMVVCYTSPQMLMLTRERLATDKLAAIIDTLFAGLSGENRGALGVSDLRSAT